MNKRKSNKNKLELYLILVSLFSLVIIFTRASYIALTPEPRNITEPGVTLQQFSKVRTTRIETIKANRGTIYDVNGKVLAQNVSSYTLIAILNENATTDEKRPRHVIDKELTAEKLSTVLNLSKEEILIHLRKREVNPNIGQVEFGSKGKGLSEITKDEILALGLPGLDFIETKKRYYPNGDFLSYALGYAKNNPDGSIVGEMGLELKYNDLLTGKDGFIEYQKDKNGYKIANTKEYKEDAIEGKDIYLTINNNIQFFVEQAIKNATDNYSFTEMNVVVADAKTGAILGMSNYPSFNPNIKNIDNYLNTNISTYEPGSTMKIYSYMATMEDGSYKGDNTFRSGTYTTKDGTELGDHVRAGWGNITFDQGFINSSNVGTLHLVKDYINREKLRDYFKKVGFGAKTNIELPNEASGKIDFRYETEIYTASYGQGITTTVMQNVKALTAISNNGVLLEPYLIKKIVDPNTNEVILENTKKELHKVASTKTVNKMKDLMEGVLQGITGTPFYIEGYDLIGKTGTAQIAKENGQGYIPGAHNVIRGFSGIYPKDDPEIIIYATVTKSEYLSPLSNAVKDIVKNTSNYLNIDNKIKKDKTEIINFKMDSFINKDLNKSVKSLKEKQVEPIILGNGNKVIDQYPKINVSVDSSQKVILLTNDTEYLMPSLNNWSRKDVNALANLLNFKVKFEDQGFVYEQSIEKDTKINKKDTLKVKLKY